MSAITIIGRGRVGGAIEQRASAVGHAVTCVDRPSFAQWCVSDVAIGQILVIATKDDVLPDVVAEIARAKASALHDVVVIHVNGSLGVEALAPLRACGARCAAAHPFQTFGSSDPTALDGIGWGVEADDAAWGSVRDLIASLGGVPWRFTDMTHERKRRYHAAAVAASNFTYAAYELARRLAAAADIPADVFLVPIMQRTLLNASTAIADSSAFAITGPLMRGDIDAVRRQLESIPASDRPLYCHLSRALLDVVGADWDADKRTAMERVLGG
jgi:predicted short-subunit dehydrogenase-like oxidoreductase (DUF2520 family)